MTPADSSRPVRSFVAIELGDEARAAVARALDAVRATGIDAAWTTPDKAHLTLKFLGGVAPDRLDDVARRLEAAVAPQAPFALLLAGIGAFPGPARPRVLWIGVHATQLGALADAVEDACAAAGFARETRPFRGHVTLGRVRAARGGARVGAAPAALRALCDAERERVWARSVCDAVTLFRSDLSPRGARYTALARVALAGPPPPG